VARYVVHRRLRIEQELAGQAAPTNMSYRVFVTSIISGADTSEYSVTYTVDSVVADTGSFVPPTVNFAAARGISFTGRISRTGVVRDLTPSDSSTAQAMAQFLGNVRDFYPRLPKDGLRPNAAWIDSVTTTDRAAGGEVQVQSVLRSTALGWEPRTIGRAMRIQVQGTFRLQGAGEQGGQPYELSGSGTRAATEFVSADGLYVGGDTRDSVSLSVHLPAQGLNVPIRQVLQSSVTVLP
jgi:hypothetical protein